eukprot:CAMPEP_0194747986 /NCGR_PEP_ID=MMETSP0323_2-20130528/2202_1 /TAXON_ID=2866 ORGANISM="Crypthecodinium cohnii, Strain Seligo" /NCGR_SAMPLE_ID=MMETSP0323_2 /ASSEMBLY_ACC=CAM_ASM_000346 /LENGTH=43 /DNA_ID= /DNA_START= /DNA_END= /DNA_ORIENTATION=
MGFDPNQMAAWLHGCLTSRLPGLAWPGLGGAEKGHDMGKGAAS